MNTFGYVSANPLHYVDPMGLDASLYLKDPDMADPSDFIKKPEPNLCNDDCQNVKFYVDIKTVEAANRINRTGQVIGVGVSIGVAAGTGFCLGPAGLGLSGSAASAGGSIAGSAFSFMDASIGEYTYPGDRIIFEYKVCCGSGNDFGASQTPVKTTVVRNGASRGK